MDQQVRKMTKVANVEHAVSSSCQRAGLIVVFIAHDDQFGDKCRVRTFKRYAGCAGCESLEAVVDFLQTLDETPFVCFPLPDPLHLFKNDRQRIRNHPLALLPDVPSFDASTLRELLPPQMVSVPTYPN
jgi:hypothetical protein